MPREPRYYSGRGDQGSTDLIGEYRLRKDDAVFELLGTIDELQAVLGVARAAITHKGINDLIKEIQKELSTLMGEIATLPGMVPPVDEEKIAWIEAQVKHYGDEITMPKAFIVPGDSLVSANLNLARSVTRRAERRAVALESDGRLENPLILGFLNRLSSLLFILILFIDSLEV